MSYSTYRIFSYFLIFIFLEWCLFFVFMHVDEQVLMKKIEISNYKILNKNLHFSNETKIRIKNITIPPKDKKENGLHGYKVTINIDSYNVSTCKEKAVKLSNTPLPVTGLVSFPGAGNTWVRHLIQQMTGIGTGSVYCDGGLKSKGFPFECSREKRRTIVVKTHEESHFTQFEKIVLLIRNPYDALLAYFTFAKGGHTGHPSTKVVKDACIKMFDWSVWWYKDLINGTVTRYKGPVHVLQYERLKTDMANELGRLAKFLEVNVTQRDIACTVKLQEGRFHRKTSNDEHLKVLQAIYDSNKLHILENVTNTIEKLLKDRLNLDIDVGTTIEKILLVE